MPTHICFVGLILYKINLTNIKDFLNLESQKVEHLTVKEKVKALLTSVINELIINGNLKKSDAQDILLDTQAAINFMNKIDYRSELLKSNWLVSNVDFILMRTATQHQRNEDGNS